ncbi:hypothetical protein [Rhizobium sp. RCAM05973]|uniref:hypothetical protein n=1 Tax=Rhizobium sp. RCAM05973 TaxID=2994066 RepID=UPI0022EBC6FC|nr:hypothetical protein [Rhizobium sp. RCAM05973]
MPLSRRHSAAIFGTSLAAALLAVTAQCVKAQTRTTKTDSPAAAAPASSAAPVSSEPNTTTASFGDWTLRCQRVGEAGKATRVCEVAQAMQVQGQTAPVAQIAIGRLSPANRCG